MLRFGTDGVRGVALTELTEQYVVDLGCDFFLIEAHCQATEQNILFTGEIWKKYSTNA